MATKRTKWQEWAKRVDAWRRSGESAAIFAGRHGWNPRTLTWWSCQGLRRKRAAGVGGAAAPEVTFAEVAPQREPAKRDGVVDVLLRNGRRVRIRGGVNPDVLCALVRALEA